MKKWFMICAVSLIGYAFGDQPPPEPIIEPVAPQYDNRFGFMFDRVVFDHNKAECIYFGLDFWMPYFFSNSRNGHFGALYEGEVRVGYNLFYNGCDHISPLAGVGYQYNNVGVFKHAKFAYATAGFRYLHEFNTVFGWGFYLKGLAGQQIGKDEAKKFAWGVDLSMPFVFRFAKGRRWDVTLEPFYLYMESNHKNQGIFGGRGTFGYRF
jgi:hypothetical protein